MKFSSKVEKCGLSPMRKFHPYAVAAKARGINIYHLNIGQPDVLTPPAFFEAVRHFEQPVLAYAPSPGIPELIDAIQNYYDKLDMHFGKSEIYVTAGGSEALQIALQCILDDGDEILIPEPFYPNYNTMTRTCGASIRPIPTCPEEGYHYADREKIESLINEHTRAIMVTNPGNPTGVVLSHEEMEMLVDVAQKHDLFLIGDEAYREFVYGGEKLQSFGESMIDLSDGLSSDLMQICKSSACGARIGCLISKNRELMNHAMKYCQARLSVATLDQIASAALYTVGPEYFAAVRDEYKKRRRDPRRGVRRAGWRVLRDGRAAGRRCRQVPAMAARGIQRQRRDRDDGPGRLDVRDAREGQKRSPHGLRPRKRQARARHGYPQKGHRGLQRQIKRRRYL